MLFQLRGPSNLQDDSMLIFFPDSYSSIYGISNDVPFVSEFFRKLVEKAGIEKQSIRGTVFAGPTILQL